MERFIIQVPNRKISQVRRFLADLNIRINPLSNEHAPREQATKDAVSDDISGLTAVGFDAWAVDWKDDADENKVWEAFYRNQRRVSTR